MEKDRQHPDQTPAPTENEGVADRSGLPPSTSGQTPPEPEAEESSRSPLPEDWKPPGPSARAWSPSRINSKVVGTKRQPAAGKKKKLYGAAEQKYDWKKLEKLWLTGVWRNFREFAEAQEIPYGYIRNVAMRRHWKVRRETYRAHISETVGKVLDGFQEGSTNIKAFRRESALASYVSLTLLRDDPDIAPGVRAQIADKLLSLDGLPKLDDDLETQEDRELGAEEVDEVFFISRRLRRLRSLTAAAPSDARPSLRGSEEDTED